MTDGFGDGGGGDAARLRRLAVALRLLERVEIDYDDPAQETPYLRLAEQLVAQVIATPAGDLAGARTKAEAVAWCCASRTDFTLGEALSSRVIGSLLRDLLDGGEDT